MWIRTLLLVSLMLICIPILAQTPSGPLTERERMLLDRIEKFEQRLAAVEAAQKPPAAPAAPPKAAPEEQRSPTGDGRRAYHPVRLDRLSDSH